MEYIPWTTQLQWQTFNVIIINVVPPPKDRMSLLETNQCNLLIDNEIKENNY